MFTTSFYIYLLFLYHLNIICEKFHFKKMLLSFQNKSVLNKTNYFWFLLNFVLFSLIAYLTINRKNPYSQN